MSLERPPSVARCAPKSPHPLARRRAQRGFALLLVIWVLAILAVLAAAFAASTRSGTRLARNVVDTARARALAEAGVWRAVAALLEPDPRNQWRPAAPPRQMTLDDGVVSVVIEDEAGKIDINRGPLEPLPALCGEIAIDGATCSALVAGIDARRRSAAPALGATLRGQRFEQGLAAAGIGGARPPDRIGAAAFGTLDELRQLPGIDAPTLERLRPYLTVYSQSAAIDPAVAARELLLALPGIDPREVELLLAARAAPPSASFAAAPALTGISRFLGGGQLRAVTILATATTDTGAIFTRRAVVALTGVVLRPAQVLEWRQDLGGDTEPPR
jgi:general secretion pathway protein K